MSEYLKEVAARIKRCMNDKGLRQVDIVKTTGVSKSSVSKWLGGRACPSGEYLLRLSQVLDKPEYWILNGEYPYSSYADIDDAMDYLNSVEEDNRQIYIKKLGLDPKLPYSIRYLRDEFEDRMYCEHEHQFELSAEQEKQIEAYEEEKYERWFESNITVDNMLENRDTLKEIEKLFNSTNFISNFQYSNKSLRSPSEIAERSKTQLDKTLYYSQEDISMEPVIMRGAQCSVDLSKRTIRDGKIYLIRRYDFYGMRTLFSQSDGSLLLQSKNINYPNEVVSKNEVDSLVIIGYVYAWANFDPWEN
ncbi:helix-turn-helix domain-containing protein [Psychrobacter sp. CCUG 69069]|jgi:transcriptional regulator with XRE-family HTH domain|uniref:XRE family transcriptional regulator n=1 Tax=unclassified Psychrobacter TaxID=196806 RepID=UPI000C7DFE0A|nr:MULTISPECIES: helix-turn-helix domain-containing protein [unclassified Psychrobacter]MCD1278287.1 helix-turn-helix domain-containing protein [Psychrobacter sp. CCUG 69069]PKG68014.1 hypothetical protein CXF56_00725 [Psychrobacter sp. Choline-02u-13]PKH55038.1 hypothetical protein CXF69_00780 [Psychrobacter sp. Choline-02u-9]PKH69458.1 hypothetical protein CXF61_00225 [Psychrobacter sp. 4Dc]|tara:strand:- start:1080 stop:1991 length:912 start_codon:yes stop_codon:yes gene_type:complete